MHFKKCASNKKIAITQSFVCVVAEIGKRYMRNATELIEDMKVNLDLQPTILYLNASNIFYCCFTDKSKYYYFIEIQWVSCNI